MNLGSRIKKRILTCYAFFPWAVATFPGIRVGRYLFSEPNDDLTKSTELSIVIRWTKFIVYVTRSLFPFCICGDIFGIRLQEILKKKRRRKGSANYSVYFIALIRFLTSYQDTENYILFPVLCCVFSLPLNWRRDCSVLPTQQNHQRKDFFTGSDRKSRNIFTV
jgi:hypothetical protein